MYHAFGYVKKAAALVNGAAGRLPAVEGVADRAGCDEVIAGELDDAVPALRLADRLGHPVEHERQRGDRQPRDPAGGRGRSGRKTPVHPNDHVNMGQSSNDTFPTAMHIAAVPSWCSSGSSRSVTALRDAIAAKAEQWVDVVKIGRTHLQDAMPLTVGQEWSGYAAQLSDALDVLARVVRRACTSSRSGGTAVGTGLNAPPGSARRSRPRSPSRPGYPFVTAPNKFAALGALDAMVGGVGRRCAGWRWR